MSHLIKCDCMKTIVMKDVAWQVLLLDEWADGAGQVGAGGWHGSLNMP